MRQTILIIILLSTLSCKRTTNKETTDLKDEKFKTENTLKCQPEDKELIYEYLPDTEIPEHLFTIILSCKEDQFQGIIFGPDPEGEHGLYYFLADLQKLSIDSLNNIEFEFNMGSLLTKQVTLDNYKGTHEDAGFAKAILKFRGTNYKDSLVVNCTSEYDECYTEKMTFRLKTNSTQQSL